MIDAGDFHLRLRPELVPVRLAQRRAGAAAGDAPGGAGAGPPGALYHGSPGLGRLGSAAGGTGPGEQARGLPPDPPGHSCRGEWADAGQLAAAAGPRSPARSRRHSARSHALHGRADRLGHPPELAPERRPGGADRVPAGAGRSGTGRQFARPRSGVLAPFQLPQGSKPFAHPCCWAAFVLVGDPD